ncbi:MAG: hypothetical protein JNM76_07305 [Betaproteobacteria bacterium]|nr:hypothetical protein [Betaproteobacteria bacterium]
MLDVAEALCSLTALGEFKATSALRAKRCKGRSLLAAVLFQLAILAPP